MKTTEHQATRGDTQEAEFTRMTDAEWEDATARVQRTVARHAHVDFDQLADRVVDRYILSRAALAGKDKHPQPTVDVNAAAAAATASMVSNLVGTHTDKARLNATWTSILGFLCPPLAVLVIVYAWHSRVGWYGIPMSVLLAGFAAFAVVSVGLMSSYIRSGILVRRLTTQAALALSVGALAATFLSPFLIQELRTNETSKLMLASGDLGGYMVDALASLNPRPIRRIAYLAEKQDDYGLVAERIESNSAVSIETRGLPGRLTATVDSPDSGRVTWSRPLRAEITKSLIKQGFIDPAAPGGVRLITSERSYPLKDTLLDTLPDRRTPVIALIDASTLTVTRLVPLPQTTRSEPETSKMPATAPSTQAASAVR